MVASSEQQSAPVIVNRPATAQARSSHPGAPLNRDDSADDHRGVHWSERADKTGFLALILQLVFHSDD